MTLKPSSCVGCRCYKETVMETGQGARPSTVVFLAGSPPPWGGLYNDRAGRIVRATVSELLKEENAQRLPLGKRPIEAMSRGKFFMYCVQCAAGKLDKDIISHCAGSVTHQTILQCNPAVIVAMGNAPLRSVGIVGSIKKLRGYPLITQIGGTQYTVLPTISPISLIKDEMGLFSIFKEDLKKAAQIAFTKTVVKVGLTSLKDTYEVPASIEELKALSEDYSTYRQKGRAAKNTLMALDTETNTLFPWESGAKIIMVSASVDVQKACSIVLEHRDAPYDWKKALPYVLKITMSTHPKAWWNYKFDYMMFRYSLMPKLRSLCSDAVYLAKLEATVGATLQEILACSGVNNTRWDGLMGEHMLDEDKKGHYSLKEVVADYVPEFAGYEDELKEQFELATARKVSSATDSFVDPIYTNKLEGLEENPAPFQILPGSSYSEAYESAEATLLSIKTLSKGLKQQKKQPEYARIRNRMALISAWMRDYRIQDKAYQKVIRAYRKTVLAENASRVNKESMVTYEDLDLGMLSIYAAADADTTRRISIEQRIRAHNEDPPSDKGAVRMITLMNRHYLPLTTILADMQATGVFIDTAYIETLVTSLGIEIKDHEETIKNIIHEDLGLNRDSIVLGNPKFLANVLIGGYGLPKIKETDKGQASMDEASLKEYIEMGNPVAEHLLTWRRLCKAKSTYIDRIKKLALKDGRVHGDIHLNGTSTGRTSSSRPNLQNTPKRIGKVNIKKVFIPTPIHSKEWWESPGNCAFAHNYGWSKSDKLVWIDIDFSGAEVRILTRYAPDKGLIQALKEGLDVHSWMTAEINGLDYDDVEYGRKTDASLEELRRDTKRVVFGTLYGITAHGLHERMGYSEERAQEIIDKLMNRFPAIKQYITRTQIKISKEGRVNTPYGRFRRFPMVRMGRWIEGRNQRQGVNFLIQSYCSDVVMSCMSNISQGLSEIQGRLLLTVHDSICLEMPSNRVADLPEFLSKYITEHIADRFGDIPVPMPYDVAVGFSYGETEDLTNWLAKHETTKQRN